MEMFDLLKATKSSKRLPPWQPSCWAVPAALGAAPRSFSCCQQPLACSKVCREVKGELLLVVQPTDLGGGKKGGSMEKGWRITREWAWRNSELALRPKWPWGHWVRATSQLPVCSPKTSVHEAGSFSVALPWLRHAHCTSYCIATRGRLSPDDAC